MKKVIGLCLSLMILFSLYPIVAYTAGSPVGTWAGSGPGMVYVLKIYEDKTCIWVWSYLKDGGQISIMDGTWSQKGKVVTVSTEEGEIKAGTLSNGKALTMTISKQTIDYTFTDENYLVHPQGNKYTKISPTP